MPKYINDDYDIGKAFAAIEEELISSMMRNLARHRAEETEKGFNWTAWQVEQLKALEQYRKDNQEKFRGKFSSINASIDVMISEARAAGGTEQELRILNQIKKGFTASKASTKGVEGDFFRLNTRKLDALVHATKDDLKTAEHAMLRMADDKYRKIIFNAQVYANTGAGTYEKAVDMATKDFLSAGINCIEYKNGSRHSVQEYAKMAIKTANKRAYLTGEGEKRKEWGISTVILKKRGNACPKCLPFCGKVLIDDVWSGGIADGKHLTMSWAIEQGLYHPNCLDIHTTYFEGITRPAAEYTKEEMAQIEEDYKRKQQQQNAKRQAEKFDRLQKYSLDEENKRTYAARADEWRQRADFYDIELQKAQAMSEIDRYHACEHHVNLMRDIIKNATYKNIAAMGGAYAYLPDSDVIAVNLKHPDAHKYPENYAIVHETSHRADVLIYNSLSSKEFAKALDICSKKVMAQKDVLQKLVDEGGKYENDLAIQDILYMLSGGQIAGSVGHPNADREIIILETFANMSTMDLLGYESCEEFKGILKELYDAYLKLIGG